MSTKLSSLSPSTLSEDLWIAVNRPQQMASDPAVSAWVAASAGSGKTKVLTDRLLTLMLTGSAPDRLICLTFTKAAAAEMANRLTDRLRRWAHLKTDTLMGDLTSLLPHVLVTSDHIHRARSLFTQVLDTPGGMKIMTIHSFCQSILKRFPLEAGIPPHFTILDDTMADELLISASDRILRRPPSPDVATAITTLASTMGDYVFSQLIEDLNANRHQLLTIFAAHPTAEERSAHLSQLLNIPLSYLHLSPGTETLSHLLNTAYTPSSALWNHALDLQEKYPWLHTWLTIPEERSTLWADYKSLYITKKNEPLKRPKINCPEELESIMELTRLYNAATIAQRTLALLAVAEHILNTYKQGKERQGALDYDDLIDKTQTLLAQPGIAAWVLYKLDGGIDHLLVDEAQDTNPKQWSVIRALSAEFFTTQEKKRTIFAVGDAKQSIYSFQGARPETFIELRSLFASECKAVKCAWRDVQLAVSFRSAPEILTVVDRVFTADTRGVSFEGEAISHHPFRQNAQGIVSVWPVIGAPPDTAEEAPWSLPLTRAASPTPSAQLAQRIAAHIAMLLAAGHVLDSTEKPVQPRDILILVRKRTEFLDDLIRALKNQNIPVSGADRLLLTSHIAVDDLLALGQFLCLPDDDYSLACVLKSPLIGWDENTLYDLAHERSSSLWTTLLNRAEENTAFQTALHTLRSFLKQVDFISPYRLYTQVLHQSRTAFLARLGYETADILDEFLSQILQLESTQAVTLQQVIAVLSQTPITIKRDTADTQRNEVRLMTVHGSKGLQAPIVFLPEAIGTRSQRDSLLWEKDFVLIRPAAEMDIPQTITMKQTVHAAEQAEDQRLLYVALTRAQDQLYLCGWSTKSADKIDLTGSWMNQVREALHALGVTPKEDGTLTYGRSFKGSLIPKTVSSTESMLPPLPKYFFEPAASSAPLSATTSQSAADSAITYDPIAAQRGILIHELFDVLSGFPPHQRPAVMARVLQHRQASLSTTDQEQILRILSDNPTLFGPQTFTELDISDGEKTYRLDRVVITSTDVHIIDYKTAIHPPKTLADVPLVYREQLETYAAILNKLYPQHTIRASLLWTQGPTLMPILF